MLSSVRVANEGPAGVAHANVVAPVIRYVQAGTHKLEVVGFGEQDVQVRNWLAERQPAFETFALMYAGLVIDAGARKLVLKRRETRGADLITQWSKPGCPVGIGPGLTVVGQYCDKWTHRQEFFGAAG